MCLCEVCGVCVCVRFVLCVSVWGVWCLCLCGVCGVCACVGCVVCGVCVYVGCVGSVSV